MASVRPLGAVSLCSVSLRLRRDKPAFSEPGSCSRYARSAGRAGRFPATLEAVVMSAQVAKVTNENYHKAMDEVNAKFKRYEVSAVCADLQDQIMKCYRENVGKTLLCSRLASLYLQCVSDAKQVGTGTRSSATVRPTSLPSPCPTRQCEWRVLREACRRVRLRTRSVLAAALSGANTDASEDLLLMRGEETNRGEERKEKDGRRGAREKGEMGGEERETALKGFSECQFMGHCLRDECDKYSQERDAGDGWAVSCAKPQNTGSLDIAAREKSKR
ncbi:hypothetical protein P4O66_014236, partial [Electrophorus voltai]